MDCGKQASCGWRVVGGTSKRRTPRRTRRYTEENAVSEHPLSKVSYISVYDITCRDYRGTIQSRHEEANSVGLSGPGRVPLSDPEVSAFQRARGTGRGAGAGAVPAHAGHQRDAGGSAAADPGTGQPDADPASQCGGTGEPAGVWWIR